MKSARTMRKLIIVTLLLLFSIPAIGQETPKYPAIYKGYFETVFPTYHINAKGNAEIWFCVFRFNKSTEYWEPILCISRRVGLFDGIVTRLSSRVANNPFSEIVRVKGRDLPDRRWWIGKRMLVKSIKWIKSKDN